MTSDPVMYPAPQHWRNRKSKPDAPETACRTHAGCHSHKYAHSHPTRVASSLRKQLANQLRTLADKLDPPLYRFVDGGTMTVHWDGDWVLNYDPATIARIARKEFNGNVATPAELGIDIDAVTREWQKRARRRAPQTQGAGYGDRSSPDLGFDRTDTE